MRTDLRSIPPGYLLAIPTEIGSTNRRLVWILTGPAPPWYIGNLDFAHRRSRDTETLEVLESQLTEGQIFPNPSAAACRSCMEYTPVSELLQ